MSPCAVFSVVASVGSVGSAKDGDVDLRAVVMLLVRVEGCGVPGLVVGGSGRLLLARRTARV